MSYLSDFLYLEPRTELVTLDHETFSKFARAGALQSFDCGIPDMNTFLIKQALMYDDLGISKTHLLIHSSSEEIMGYISLCTSQFMLTKEEKAIAGLDLPFSSVPSITIGKIATSLNYKGLKVGSYLLTLTQGMAHELIEQGIAVRFLTLDANIGNDENLVEFYEKNGFVVNTHKDYLNRHKSGKVSMRYDLFQ